MIFFIITVWSQNISERTEAVLRQTGVTVFTDSRSVNNMQEREAIFFFSLMSVKQLQCLELIV